MLQKLKMLLVALLLALLPCEALAEDTYSIEVSCLSNWEHHGLLSLRWEDGQGSLWGAPPDVCVS